MAKKILAAVLTIFLLLPAVISAGSLVFTPKSHFAEFDSDREVAILASLGEIKAGKAKSGEGLLSGDRYIVKFKSSASLETIETALGDVSYQPLSDSESRIFVIASEYDGFISANSEIIEYSEPDLVRNTLAVTNDPVQTEAYESLGIYSAWDTVQASNNVIVAVLDTGVDRTHEDLADTRILPGYDAVARTIGVNEDTAGHGTGVVGIIAAAANNGLGMAGVASGVTILPVKVSASSTTIYSSDLISGIRFAADAGAKIINMSVGGYSYSYAEQEAVNYAVSKGCILISASGNGGNRPYADQKSYPASYEGVISVASCNDSGERSDFSQYNDSVDVAAYGENLNIIYCEEGMSAYRTDSGTSYSCAVVSGIAALVASYIGEDARFSGDDFLSLIIETCGSSRTDELGYGIIDAGKILSVADLPVVTGVVNGNTYSESVKIGFNRGTATLDGDPFENGETVMSNGRHTLVVTDGDNIKTVVFKLDYDPLSYEFKEFASYSYFTFERGEALLDGFPYESGERITASGRHEFVLTDGEERLEKIINSQYTLPAVYGIEDGAVYENPVDIRVVGVGDAELDGKPVYGEVTVAESGIHTLVVRSGNRAVSAEYTFEIDFPYADIFEGDYAYASVALDEENGYFCLYGEYLVGARIYDINFPDTYLCFLPVGRVYSHAFYGDKLLLFGVKGITVIDRMFALDGSEAVVETIAPEDINLYAYGDGTVYCFGNGSVYSYDLDGGDLTLLAELGFDCETAVYSDGYFCLAAPSQDGLIYVFDCETYEFYSFDSEISIVDLPIAFGEGYFAVGNRLFDIKSGKEVLEFCSEFAVKIENGLLYTDNRIIDIASGKEIGSFPITVSDIAVGTNAVYLFGTDEIFAIIDSGAEGIYAYGAAERTDRAFSDFEPVNEYRLDASYGKYAGIVSVAASESTAYVILSDRNSLYSFDMTVLSENEPVPLRFAPSGISYANGYVTVCFESNENIYVAHKDDLSNGTYIEFPSECSHAFVAGGAVYAISGGVLVSAFLGNKEIRVSEISAVTAGTDGEHIIAVAENLLVACDLAFEIVFEAAVPDGELFVGNAIAVGRNLYSKESFTNFFALNTDIVSLNGNIAVLENGIFSIENKELLGMPAVNYIETAAINETAVAVFGGGVVSFVTYGDGTRIDAQSDIEGIEQNRIYIDHVTVTYSCGIGYLDGVPFDSGETSSGTGKRTFLVTLPFGKSISVDFTVEAQISSIEFLAAERSMAVGETIGLGIIYLPEGASSVPVKFSCPSDGITIDEAGQVTASAVGKYTVTATAETDYGSFSAECVITVSDGLIAFPSESGITVNRNLGYLLGIKPGTRANKLLSILTSGGRAVFFNREGDEISGFVGTGSKLVLYDSNGEVGDELTVVVVGDTDGDGYISSYDLYIHQRILRGYSYPDEFVHAADLVSDGIITDSDHRALKNSVLGTEDPNSNSTGDNLFGSCSVQSVSRVENGNEIEVAVCISGCKYALGVSGNIVYSEGLEFVEGGSTGWETGFRDHGNSVSFYAFGTDGENCGKAFKVLLKLRFRVTAEAGETVSLSAENVTATFENGCRNVRFENADMFVYESEYGEFNIEISNAYEFEFDENTHDYSVVIPYNNALADLSVVQGEGQTVTVSSLIIPDSGEGLITVRRTSENGRVDYYYINVTRDEEPRFNTNCHLATLEVEGFRLSPSFNPDIFSYDISVPYGTEKINIYSVAQSNTAQIIVGDTTLNGENKVIEITVGSPDGETLTYIINVTVEPQSEPSSEPSEQSQDESPADTARTATIIIIALIAVASIIILYAKLSARDKDPEITEE